MVGISLIHGAASIDYLSTMSYSFHRGDLPKLDIQVDRGSDFKAWKSQWEAYLSLSGLGTQSNAKQVQALTLCLSRETVTIVDNLGLSEAQRGSVKDVVDAIQSYVEGLVNESVERRIFRRRGQQPGETFDDFLVSLRELAKTCKFCSKECTDKNIRDQIIQGLLDGDTIEDLLKEKDLSLDKTIATCRAREAAKKQRAEMVSPPGEVAAIQTMPRRAAPNSMRQTMPTTTCPGCGGSPHQGGRQHCPARGVTCYGCQKVGHFHRVCRSQRQRPGPPPPQTNSDGTIPGSRVVSTVPLMASAKLHPSLHFLPAPTIPVHMTSLNGAATVRVLPDSGADICVAGRTLLEQLNEHPDNIPSSSVTPRAVNGTSMHPIGKLPVTVSLGTQVHTAEFHIYPEVSGTLLSWEAAKELRILPPHYPDPPKPPTLRLAASEVTSQDVRTDFPTVFDGLIKTMGGEKFHIALTDDAQPFCVKAPRTIPFAYRDKLKAELELLQEQGIITPVTEPTEWCAPIVVAPKKGSDKIRMCVDLSRLNRFVKRERYQSTTPAQAVADIAAQNARVFTKLDALKGYHQCPLDEESQILTTFITPLGRFKFLRAPYGISSISEHYNRRMDEAFAGLSGYRRVVDDVVIYDSDATQHTTHVREFLQRCAECKITLNNDKWEFAKPQVTFAGFMLSENGYRVDTSITQAIANFPTPATRTDLRAFVGLANQLSASTATLANLLAPLRPLLSTKNEFTWSPDLEAAFSTAKRSLTTAPTVSYFDLEKPTRLCTDASRQGLGFTLQQKSGDRWTLVQAGSRFLSDAESRYAVIELELLAVAWAVTKCKLFLAGLPHFTVVTDHHPLVPILNSHRLDEIENPRLQRLRNQIISYNLTAQWIKGTMNNAPDALSRYPISDPAPHEQLAEFDHQGNPEPSIAAMRVTAMDKSDSIRLEDLRKMADTDQEYQQLLHLVRNGFPEHRHQIPEQCRPYWNTRTHLSIEDNLIVYGCRLLIPRAMRRQILQEIHASHQGEVRTKLRAKLVVYWPGLNNDIDNIISACKQCQDNLPSQPRETIIQKPRPSRPFQEIAIDFCSYAGRDFLVMVDCYTDWPDVVPMGQNTTTAHLINTLLGAFCRTGAPDTVWSDQGPQFTSKRYRDFAKEWGFQINFSSPRYPQSNGKAEATVKSMKKLIKAAWCHNELDPGRMTKALLQYRNTPSQSDHLSPAQKLFGHPIQDTIPAHRRAFAPQWQQDAEEAEQRALHHQDQAEKHYNQHARDLPELSIGSKVAVHNSCTKLWDIYGNITAIGPYRRYHIKTAGGRVLIRNRRYIRRRFPAAPPGYQHATLPAPAPSPTPDSATTPPRRSSRPHTRPPRLIEEIGST